LMKTKGVFWFQSQFSFLFRYYCVILVLKFFLSFFPMLLLGFCLIAIFFFLLFLNFRVICRSSCDIIAAETSCRVHQWRISETIIELGACTLWNRLQVGIIGMIFIRDNLSDWNGMNYTGCYVRSSVLSARGSKKVSSFCSTLFISVLFMYECRL
jgi:hypothetical protein